jgi:hypothetical protein
MSQPFAQVVAQRAAQRADAELTEEAFRRLNSWSLQSASKLVSLDEVAWLGALLIKAFKKAGLDTGLMKTETRDANGALVVGVTASDGVNVADGAG